ncbi:MAG: GreA/GreB family elongation factor [Deltaproteobacteria bacterium]
MDLAGIDKAALVAAIIAQLAAELDGVREAASSAREGATHEDAKPENQYDTRALEASYLAGAQTARAEVIEGAISVLERMQLRDFDEDTPIAFGALVQVEHDDGDEIYFVAPEGGGAKVRHADLTIRVVTLASPVGRALSKKRVGDGFELTLKRVRREYEIVAVA